ncbi:MAG: hypothetical protein Q8J97_09335, partial [Flavobacteriaceae bacterium]|nr:hypothetical protein [Flavobacteriaceae bacterium]
PQRLVLTSRYILLWRVIPMKLESASRYFCFLLSQKSKTRSDFSVRVFFKKNLLEVTMVTTKDCQVE